jgi:hypothetical protein
MGRSFTSLDITLHDNTSLQVTLLIRTKSSSMTARATITQSYILIHDQYKHLIATAARILAESPVYQSKTLDVNL